MNNYTNEQIYEKINQRIDYKELTRILEHDLNHIANTTWTEETNTIEFKAFFDFDEFETAIAFQAEGQGQPQRITPVLITLLNGDYTEPKGPQLFATTFRIEAFGFESDKDRLREIFEIYSSLNQGAILSGLFGSSLTTSFTDFPIVTPPEPYKGANRISVFMIWNLNFIFSGQLANDVKIKIDDEEIDFTAFNIRREREQDSIQRNNQDETESITRSQMLVFSGAIVYDGKEVSKKLLRNIKNLGEGLSDTFSLEIEYPEIEDTDNYTVLISSGDVSIPSGGIISLDFSMTIADAQSGV